jgi:hypothetical protein
VFEAGWLAVFHSVVSEHFRYFKHTTQTHNAPSASCYVNFRVYLTPNLSTIRGLPVRWNSVEILQHDPALCIAIN